MRLGFGQVATEKFDDVAPLPSYCAKQTLRFGDHCSADLSRAVLRNEIRIGIAPFDRQIFLQEYKELGHQFAVGRRAKSDGIGVARSERDSVMGKSRRKIKHVACA